MKKYIIELTELEYKSLLHCLGNADAMDDWSDFLKESFKNELKVWQQTLLKINNAKKLN